MSDIKRLIDLPRNEANKIRARQKAGSMNEYYDDKNYLCYSVQELENYKKGKAGRKPVNAITFIGKAEDVIKEIRSTIKFCKEMGFTTVAELIEYDECLKNKEG